MIRSLAVSLAALAFTVGAFGSVGCSSATEGATPPGAAAGAKDPVESYESELKLASPRYLGQIASGETKTSDYTDPPHYRAYGFTAKGGQQLTIEVSSVNGDAMAWLTTSSYESIAANDDATARTLDSKIVYTIPAGTASRAYRIVFRDYDLLSASFSVKLTVDGTTAACTYEGATYPAGSKWHAADDCNTCLCTSTGLVSCTTQACVCNPETEPYRTYVGTPITCETIRFSCAADQKPFKNACGCGCELLTH